MATHFDTVEGYVASLPADSQLQLQAVLDAVREAAPGADETISYQMPTFKVDGTALIHVAAWKHHIGLYPIPSGPAAFQSAMAPYATAKGTARFPLQEPMPTELVKELIRWRLAELAARQT